MVSGDTDQLQDVIKKNLNLCNLTIVISLDLLKVFDTLNHSHLILKLGQLGFTTASHRLLLSYLRGRTVKTVINSVVSKVLSITSRVPQGLILGPTIFNIYQHI